ncbi:MAG: radical SAM protein [Proteobacteria bacterium]|nr:radical SAM protein [Pseudomonadota bacterium]MBU1708671.1 radical SAM protein [Pseudomonadota bacterium]
MANDQNLLISETFYSIQGESSFAGYPCAFIRLAGCNLRCTYCDSRYTYEEVGHEVSVPDLLAFTDQYPEALVEITGGEPLVQENIYPLMTALVDSGRTVLLETNGSLDISRVPEKVVKIMDLKCPESGMNKQMLMENIRRLTPKDDLKFVICSRLDYDWATETINDHQLLGAPNGPTLIFSPALNRLEPALMARWLLEDKLQIKMQVQLHKFLWPDKSRGV